MRSFVLSALGFVVIAVTRQGSIPADEGAYPRADLLVEASQLAQPQFASGFVILDARPRAKFERGHISNAHWVDHNAWATAFGHGGDAPGWSQRIGALGLGATTKVIVYDDMFSRDAARIWWVLRYWGVDDVRLLDGGWKAWTGGSYPTETSEAAVSPVVTGRIFDQTGSYSVVVASFAVLLILCSLATSGCRTLEREQLQFPAETHEVAA